MAPLLEETLSRDVRTFPPSSPGDAAKMVQVARGETVPKRAAQSEACSPFGEPERPAHGHASSGNDNDGYCSPSSSFFTSSTDGLQPPQQFPSPSTIPSGNDGEKGQTRVFSPWGGDLTFLPPPPPPFHSGTPDDVSPRASSSCSSSVSSRSQDCLLSSFEGGSQNSTLMVQEEGESESQRVCSSRTEENSPEHKNVSDRSQENITSGSSVHFGDGGDGKTDPGGDMVSKVGGRGSELEAPGDGDLIIQHARDALEAGFPSRGEGDAFVYPATEDGQNGDLQYTQYRTPPLLPGDTGQETPSTGCHSKDNDDAIAICSHPTSHDRSGMNVQKEAYPVEQDSREITNVSGLIDDEKDISHRHHYAQYDHAEMSLSSVAEKGVGRNEGSCGSNATEPHHVLQQRTGEHRRDFQQDHDRYRGQVFEGGFTKPGCSPQGRLPSERLQGKQPPPPPPNKVTMPSDPQQLLQYEHRELLLKLLASTVSPAPLGRTGIAHHQLRPQSLPVNGDLPPGGRRGIDENLASDALRCFVNRSLNTHTDYGNSNGMGYLDSTQSNRQQGGAGPNCSPIPTMADITTAGASAILTAGVGEGRRERGDEGRWGGQQQGRRNERPRCFGTSEQSPGRVLVGNSAGGVPRMTGGYQQKQVVNGGRDDLFQVKAYGGGNGNHFNNNHTAAPGTSNHTKSSHVASFGDVDDVDPFYKTKMCPFMKGGRRTCPKEGNCTFAHSSSELRAPPDFRKTKLCRYSNGLRSICARGSRCTFAHSISELEPLTVKPYSYFHNRRYLRGGGGDSSRGGGAHQLTTVPSASSGQPLKNTPPTPRAGEQPGNETGQYEVRPDFLPNFNDFLTKVLRSQIDANTERGSSTSPSLRNGATSTATTTLSSQCVVPGSSPSSSSTSSSSVPRFPPAPEDLRSAYSKSTPTTTAAFSNKNNSNLSSSSSPCGSSPSSMSSSSEGSLPSKYPMYPLNNEVTREEAKPMNLFHQQQQIAIPEAIGADNRSDNQPDLSLLLPSLRTLLKGGSNSMEVQQHVQNRIHERSQPSPLPDAGESVSIMKAVSLFQGLCEASNITSMMTRCSPAASQKPSAWPRPPPASLAHSQYFSPVSHSLGDSNRSGVGSFGGGSTGDGAGSDMTCENGGGRGTPLRKTRRGKRGGRKKRGGGSLYPHGFMDDEIQASQLAGGDARDDCGIDNFPQNNNLILAPPNSSPVRGSGFGFHGDEREGDGRDSVMTAALWGGREGLDRQHIHSQVPGHSTVDLERALRAAVTPAALVAKGLSDLSVHNTRKVDNNTWYAVASQLASSALQQQKHFQNTASTMATSAVGGGVDVAGSKREDGESAGVYSASATTGVPGVPSLVGCPPLLPSIPSLSQGAETARKGRAFVSGEGGPGVDDEVANLWNLLGSCKGFIGTPRGKDSGTTSLQEMSASPFTSNLGSHQMIADVTRKFPGMCRDEIFSLASLLVRAADSSSGNRGNDMGGHAEGAVSRGRE